MDSGPFISVKHDKTLLTYLGNVKAAAKDATAEVRTAEAGLRKLAKDGKKIDVAQVLRVQELKNVRARYQQMARDQTSRVGRLREHVGAFRDSMGLLRSNTIADAMSGNVAGAIRGTIGDTRDVRDLLEHFGIKSQVVQRIANAIPYAVIGSQIASSMQEMLERIDRERGEARDIGKLFGAGKLNEKLFEEFQKRHSSFFSRGDAKGDALKAMSHAETLAKLAATSRGNKITGVDINDLRARTQAALERARLGKRRALTAEEESDIRNAEAQASLAGTSTAERSTALSANAQAAMRAGVYLPGADPQAPRAMKSERDALIDQLTKAASEKDVLPTNREQWLKRNPAMRNPRLIGPKNSFIRRRGTIEVASANLPENIPGGDDEAAAARGVRMDAMDKIMAGYWGGGSSPASPASVSAPASGRRSRIISNEQMIPFSASTPVEAAPFGGPVFRGAPNVSFPQQMDHSEQGPPEPFGGPVMRGGFMGPRKPQEMTNQENFRVNQDRLSGTGAERSSLQKTNDVNKD